MRTGYRLVASARQETTTNALNGYTYLTNLFQNNNRENEPFSISNLKHDIKRFALGKLGLSAYIWFDHTPDFAWKQPM